MEAWQCQQRNTWVWADGQAGEIAYSVNWGIEVESFPAGTEFWSVPKQVYVTANGIADLAGDELKALFPLKVFHTQTTQGTATSLADIHVTGAGEDVINGFYKQRGVYDRRPEYQKVDPSGDFCMGDNKKVTLCVLGFSWHFLVQGKSGIRYSAHTGSDTTSRPPTSNWVLADAAGPSPTLRFLGEDRLARSRLDIDLSNHTRLSQRCGPLPAGVTLAPPSSSHANFGMLCEKQQSQSLLQPLALNLRRADAGVLVCRCCGKWGCHIGPSLPDGEMTFAWVGLGGAGASLRRTSEPSENFRVMSALRCQHCKRVIPPRGGDLWKDCPAWLALQEHESQCWSNPNVKAKVLHTGSRLQIGLHRRLGGESLQTSAATAPISKIMSRSPLTPRPRSNEASAQLTPVKLECRYGMNSGTSSISPRVRVVHDRDLGKVFRVG
jgi:hypothetical protein